MRIFAGVIAGLALLRLLLRALGETGVTALTFAAPDDALYYLQIAWNLSHGLGSSFDGIHPTNGYQPAWCMLLTVVARFSPDRMALLHGAAVVASVLHIATGVLLARLAARLFERGLPIVVLVLWCFFPFYLPVLALEAPLNGFALALTLASITRAYSAPAAISNRAAWFGAGLAYALLVGARLDNAVFAPVLALLVGSRSREHGGGGMASLLTFFAPVAIVMSLYVIANTIAIGTPLPVSGTVKEEMQREIFRLAYDVDGSAGVWSQAAEMLRASLWSGPVSWVGAWTSNTSSTPTVASAVLAALLTACVFGVIALGRGIRDSSARRVLSATAFGVLIHFFFMVYMVGAFPRSWHWGAEGMLLVLAGPASVRWVLAAVVGHSPRWLGLGVLQWAIYGYVCAGLAAGVVDELERSRHDFVHAADIRHLEIATARHWNARLPPGTRVGSWNAGYLAYFSDLTVVNLDGLVNAPDFKPRVRREGWLDYLRAERIEHLIEAEEEPNFTPLFEHGIVRERLVMEHGSASTWLELDPVVSRPVEDPSGD